MLAIDIETVPADPDADGSNPDFLDSREFGLLGVGLGVRSRETDGREVEVLFREDIDPHSEVRLLKRICDWIQQYDDVDTIITYNGTSFDFRHLLGRAEILAQETNAEQLPATVANSLSLPSHRDLFHEYQRRHSSWASLEDALDEYGLDVPDPVYWNDEKVTNARIPQLGTDYLCGRAGLSSEVPVDALEETLREYTRRDVEPLFDLAGEMEIGQLQRRWQQKALGGADW
jgi:hypothetical protein